MNIYLVPIIVFRVSNKKFYCAFSLSLSFQIERLFVQYFFWLLWNTFATTHTHTQNCLHSVKVTFPLHAFLVLDSRSPIQLFAAKRADLSRE